MITVGSLLPGTIIGHYVPDVSYGNKLSIMLATLESGDDVNKTAIRSTQTIKNGMLVIGLQEVYQACKTNVVLWHLLHLHIAVVSFLSVSK